MRASVCSTISTGDTARRAISAANSVAEVKASSLTCTPNSGTSQRCHCERSEAISRPPSLPSRDCFVAQASRNDGGLLPGQRLFEVGDQIVGVFDTDRQSQQIAWHRRSGAL